MQFHLPDFNQARVLVVGDLMLDRYWQGAAARISPEAPVPVVHIHDCEERPGGGANVALNMTSLGIKVALCGLVGGDEAGSSLTEHLRQAGVACHFQVDNAIPTITKLRVISQHQQLIRLDFEQPLWQSDLAELEALSLQQLPTSDLVILSDYAKGTLQQPQRLIDRANDLGIPVLVDPKGGDFSKYRNATLLTPNLKEFEAIVGRSDTDQELNEKGMALRQQLNLKALLITLSERGMLLIVEEEPPLHLPTRARDVFDVTGAGDTVIGVLGAGMAAGMAVQEAAGLANVAAGLMVAKLGAGSVSLGELKGALRRQGDFQTVLSRDELREAADEARFHGERIVMTNGCFDIIHEGHVRYLQQAKQLGDRLVVAVNDDDSVTRLKGEGRPINGIKQRMAVLAGLASVDWVVAFSEDTPESLICEIKPDLLVKGGDYRPEDIAGYDCVTQNGGEVRVLEYLEGVSTSRIVEAMRDAE
ncbi:MAG: bifunctional heptose 7-phosphate kinase/heptose 1-phosphate adenyltransferase [gamma proteobacterium symbiont of Ctena orbiculata]|uniref:Bifunctional protein HldE n=1 Tax=Candidatus Thiodiazotropha taylori TaxID=2792791 RepID=A0A944QTE7_9GAMM|nr:bifunctional D-glycero-beta-D-manno-heptose-7-phosphate kinase/D-glycero-beta-D-manno-heptose 1-phosphate adenylyltransferase HldE [Candidatus Thiodiazotropha taylori]PUB84558.1 MAG: bifunctional heptose 7-phosphate kinase/heptose 1-phosphate adenyltransferase [gamma proteobacterium symbiont of Ctena orbiculata]MBT2987556.1 bifunctional D-glycero-beta-D-manno-heptose-7-phosphate kinase/D-glycero-beta-D-manno-heptose 1-phosphate adenylyltransferase HldE [Candidatus Thiodiazotropha taylori]MBT2